MVETPHTGGVGETSYHTVGWHRDAVWIGRAGWRCCETHARQIPSATAFGSPHQRSRRFTRLATNQCDVDCRHVLSLGRLIWIALNCGIYVRATSSRRQQQARRSPRRNLKRSASEVGDAQQGAREKALLTRAARATEAGRGSTSSAACSPVRSMGFPPTPHGSGAPRRPGK